MLNEKFCVGGFMDVHMRAIGGRVQSGELVLNIEAKTKIRKTAYCKLWLRAEFCKIFGIEIDWPETTRC